MAARLETVRKARLAKLAQLKKLNVNPYPAGCVRTHTAAEALASFGKRVAVAGRIWSIRSHGGSAFADLRDQSGDIQVFFARDELSPQEFSSVKLLDVGDFINVQGKVFKTQAGETTIRAKKLTLLAKSLRPLPTSWSGLKDIEERYRQRYADLLINPEVREIALTRTKIIKELRVFLEEKGFVEVETPILQPLYGGASAAPFVTHHKALDTTFYLRISDELYLKRLIVGGFEKVYEIGRDFRNEGIDRSHNPEFTMLEFYWAYADIDDLITLSEEMFRTILTRVKGSLKVTSGRAELDFVPPWPRKTFRDALLETTGVDVDKTQNESQIRALLRKKKIPVPKGVVGYGPLVDLLWKKVARPAITQPTLIINWPAQMLALAKREASDQTKVGAFQLVVKGMEVIKAYNELNDPIDQRKRWEEQEKLVKRGFGEGERLDEDYLRALEYGMPPTAGWGMGIDRFVMLLTGAKNIKDVILFPTLRPEK